MGKKVQSFLVLLGIVAVISIGVKLLPADKDALPPHTTQRYANSLWIEVTKPITHAQCRALIIEQTGKILKESKAWIADKYIVFKTCDHGVLRRDTLCESVTGSNPEVKFATGQNPKCWKASAWITEQ